MFSKRNVTLLSLGICVIVALQAESDLLSRLRARHIKETVFVSAGNRRLAGFFDGLTPDPHWDARKALQTARGVSQCGANRGGGLLAGLAALFERTAHAQVQCGTSNCGGNWQSVASGSCGTSCLPLTYATTGDTYCQGAYIDGSSGCSGSPQNCSNGCNNSTCQNTNCGGGGGCTQNGGTCTAPLDCCSGNCLEGVCQSVQ